MDVIIYHNPDCGTSRNTLGLIRNAGIEPHIIEYLKTPPSRILLKQLIDRMGVSVRDVIREKGTPYAELGLVGSEPHGGPASRRHDGPSDPDQPADRGDARGREALSAFGGRARHLAAAAARRPSQRRMASLSSTSRAGGFRRRDA